MKDVINALRSVLRHESVSHRLHTSHNWAHMAYLGAVGAEAHGWYGNCAIVLFAITVVMTFAGEAE